MVRVPWPVLQKQPSFKCSYRRGRSHSFRTQRNPDQKPAPAAKTRSEKRGSAAGTRSCPLCACRRCGAGLAHTSPPCLGPLCAPRSAASAPCPTFLRLPASCPEPRPALSLRGGFPTNERQQPGPPRVPVRSVAALTAVAQQWGAATGREPGGGVMPAAEHQWPLQPSAPGESQAPMQPGHPRGCWQRFQRLQARAVRRSVCVAVKDWLSLSPVTIRSPRRLLKSDLGGSGLADR